MGSEIILYIVAFLAKYDMKMVKALLLEMHNTF